MTLAGNRTPMSLNSDGLLPVEGSEPTYRASSGMAAVDLEGADHEEREVGGVGEPRAVERQHLRAVERRDALGGERVRRVVVRGVDLLDALAEHLAGAAAAVGDRGLELAFHERERLGVVAWRDDELIEELQRRFELRRGRRTVDAVRRRRDERRRGGQLAGEHALQVERFQARRHRKPNVARGQRRIDEVRPRGASDAPPSAYIVNSTWSFLKSVGLSQASTPLANRTTVTPMFGELAARFDARAVRALFDERARRGRIAPRRDRHFVGRRRSPRGRSPSVGGGQARLLRLHGQHDAALARQARACEGRSLPRA